MANKGIDSSTQRVERLIKLEAVPTYLVQELLDQRDELLQSVAELKAQNEAYSRRDNAAVTQVIEKSPYILVVDDDSHWYVIPKAKHARWEVWVDSSNSIVPDYAVRIGGNPSNVEFNEYVLR